MNPPTTLRPVAKKKKRLLFGKKRAQQQAARQEILEEIKHNPIGGYGLYHVLEDAGLLSKETKKELQPIIARIAPRLNLNEEALKITLPMQFEPITDIEHDTLTAVIGKALKEFGRAIPNLEDSLRLAELFGLNDMLERHLKHTAAIDYEVRLEQILVPLLKHCGKRLPYHRPDRLPNAQPGDFFHITMLRRSKQRFAKQFMAERNIEEGEVVQVDEVWEQGYLRARRLSYASTYSRAWMFEYLNRQLPQEGHLTVVQKDEGLLYRLNARYEKVINQFVTLYRAHLPDQSEDPTMYRPIGPTRP